MAKTVKRCNWGHWNCAKTHKGAGPSTQANLNPSKTNTPTIPTKAETTSLDSMNSNYGKLFNAYENIVSVPTSDPAVPEYVAANKERRARIRREVEEKPLMNYRYAYCPDCGQRVAVYTNRASTHAVPHSGCPYGHLYREAKHDFDRQCAEIIIGEDEGAPLNSYTVLWREEQVEVFAENPADAQKVAMEDLKSVAGTRIIHPDDMTTELTEKNGSPVTF